MCLLHAPPKQQLWLILQACVTVPPFICASHFAWLLVPWFKLFNPVQTSASPAHFSVFGLLHELQVLLYHLLSFCAENND